MSQPSEAASCTLEQKIVGGKNLPFVAVTYVNPNVELWMKHRETHVTYLEHLLEEGVLRASGPFRNTPAKSVLTILLAENRDAALGAIARDSFQIHGIVTETALTEWDSIFGAFSSESSRPSAASAQDRRLPAGQDQTQATH